MFVFKPQNLCRLYEYQLLHPEDKNFRTGHVSGRIFCGHLPEIGVPRLYIHLKACTCDSGFKCRRGILGAKRYGITADVVIHITATPFQDDRSGSA